MRYAKLLLPLVLLVAVILMTGCQQLRFLMPTTETEDVVLRRDVCDSWRLILVSRSDVFTVGTQTQVADNNAARRVWCPDEKPAAKKPQTP